MDEKLQSPPEAEEADLTPQEETRYRNLLNTGISSALAMSRIRQERGESANMGRPKLMDVNTAPKYPTAAEKRLPFGQAVVEHLGSIYEERLKSEAEAKKGPSEEQMLHLLSPTEAEREQTQQPDDTAA